MNDICDMDESLKRNVEWKKFDTKRTNRLFPFISTKQVKFIYDDRN